jgi:hypothetical protein
VLFAFSRFVLRRLADLLASGEPERGRRWTVALAATAAALSGLLAAAVAALPSGHGAAEQGGAAERAALFLVLFLLPFAAAWLARLGAELQARRDVALARALDWDRVRCERLTERARCTAMIDAADADVARLEREKAALARRVERLELRLREVERREAELSEADEAELSRLAQTLVGALELDRFEFLRQASSRTAAALSRVSHERPPERGARHEGSVQGDKSLGLAS